MAESMTVERALRWLKELQGERTQLEAEWLIDDDLARLNYKFAVPDAVRAAGRKITPPTPYHIIRTMADLIAMEFRIHVEPLNGEVKLDTEAADAVERWVGAWLWRCAMDAPLRGDDPPFRANVKLMALRGMSYLRVLYKPDAIPPAPKRREFVGAGSTKLYERAQVRWQRDSANVNPILLQCRDPMAVYEDNDLIIESYERRIRDVRAEFPDEFGDRTGTVSWVEVWTPEDILYIADGREVERKADGKLVGGNPYGFVPYAAAYAGGGLGSEIAPGGLRGGPERRVWGMLRPLRSMLEEAGRRWTQLGEINHEQAWRLPIWSNAELLAQYPGLKQVLMGPDAEVQLPSGVQLEFSQPMPPTATVMQEIMAIDAVINEAGIPTLLTGMRPPGVDTARQTELLAAFATTFLGPVVEAANAQASTVAHFALKILADVIDEPVSLRGRHGKETGRFTLDPKTDIRGHWFPDVTFKPGLPMDKTALAAQGETVKGVISRERWLTDFYGIEDAKAEIDKARDERFQAGFDAALIATPGVQQAVVADATAAVTPETTPVPPVPAGAPAQRVESATAPMQSPTMPAPQSMGAPA